MIGGVSYYPDNVPEREWARDLEQIRDAGFELLRFGEFSWQWFEPEEGQFDFSALDRFMDLAQAVGLRVILCTPTPAPPAWLLHRYPQVFMRDQNDRPHPGGRNMVNYNDPTAERLAERMIRQLASQYRTHPALYGWQIGNEPTMGESPDPARFYDFHPTTVARFRTFLQSCYGTLDQLNAAWHNTFWSRTYTDWEEIQPPWGPKVPGNPGLWLAWMRFRASNVAEFVHWQRDLLRSINKNFVIGTNIPETGPWGNAWFAQDYAWQSEGLDYVGADIYCYVGDRQEEAHIIGYGSDLVRSMAEEVGARFWISETAAGPARVPWRAEGWWGEEFLAPATQAFAAHGAEIILYFRWRAEPGGAEFGGNATVGFDGQPTALSRSVGAMLKSSSAVAKPGGPVVHVHYSQDSFRLAVSVDPDFVAETAVHGWYRWLADCGVRIQFVSDRGIQSRHWTADDLLILPYTTIVGSALAQGLETALKSHARLWLSPYTGFFSDDPRFYPIVPGPSLYQASGVRVLALNAPSSQQCDRWQAPEIHPIAALIGQAECQSNVQVRYASQGGVPLVAEHDRVTTFLLDLGTLYAKAAPEERAWLIQHLAPLRSW